MSCLPSGGAEVLLGTSLQLAHSSTDNHKRQRTEVEQTSPHLYTSVATPSSSPVHISIRPKESASMLVKVLSRVLTVTSVGSVGTASACMTSDGEYRARIAATRCLDRSSWRCPVKIRDVSPDTRRGSIWIDWWEPRRGDEIPHTSVSLGDRAALTGTA